MTAATPFESSTRWDPTVALLVDSRHAEYLMTMSTIVPAMKHWGISHQLIDLATTADLVHAMGRHAVTVIAQEYFAESLSSSAIAVLAQRVKDGGALVNLDHTLHQYPTEYREVLGLSGKCEEFDIDELLIPDTRHPVLTGRPRGKGPRLRLPLPALRTAGQITGDVLLAAGNGEPLLVSRELDAGRIVQWLVSPKVWNRGYLGLAHGIDALLWRSIAWAAPKPFVMNSLLPYVRFRFDDCYGHWQNPSDLGFVDELNKLGHTPSICFCFKALTADGIDYLAGLQRAGKVDLAPHTYAPGQSFFYGTENGEYTPEQFQAMFTELDAAKESWNVNWSTILSDHEHETSASALPFLRDRGIRHKMNILLPGPQKWADPHVDWHPAPYGSMSYALDYLPGEFSDFFAVFNHHPSFDSARVYTSDDNVHFNYHRPGGYGRQKWDFLNGLITGPDTAEKNLDAAADRLAEHTQIGLDAQFFGGSISHSHFTRHLAPGDMTRIVQRADAKLDGLEQIPASYDEIADYSEAHANTEVHRARNNDGRITVDLTGRSWRELSLSIFDEADGVLVRSSTPIPAFDGTTSVTVEHNTVS